MNTPNDNPLIYKEEQISSDVHHSKIFEFNGKKWAILSSGAKNSEDIA